MYFGPVIKRFEVGYNDGLNGYAEHPILSRDQNYQDGFRQGRAMRASADRTVWSVVCEWAILLAAMTVQLIAVLIVIMFFYWTFTLTT